jgi:hypothetical protein
MLFWLPLLFAVVTTIGSIVYATAEGLQALRAFKQLGRAAGEELERIERSSAAIERHLGLAAESGGRLDASLRRLRSSRARLSVLASALADVRAAVFRVTDVVPRK